MTEKKIEVIGCTIQLKDKQIYLSIDEARQLKAELEKMFPTPAISIPYAPSPCWPQPKPYELDPNPYTPDPNNPNRPYITWCYSTSK